MIQAFKSRFKYFVRLAIALPVMTLLACSYVAPPDIGMDALAPNSHWITAVEHSGDPLGYRLLLVDVQEGKPTFLTVYIAALSSVSGFSPDSRYVLFLEIIPDPLSLSLTLAEIGTDQRIQLANVIGGPAAILFLPDGKLLMTESTNNLKQFFVTTPTHPNDKTLVVDRVLHIFPTNYLGTGAPPGCAPLPVHAPSPLRRMTDRILWLILNADDKVFIFDTSRAGGPVQEVAAGPAGSIKTLMAKQLTMYPIDRQSVEEKLLREASEESKVLTPEELASQVETEVYGLTTEKIASTLLAAFSPDRTKLLFLSIEPEDRYSLYLVDLTSEGEPLELFSSMQADWRPSFAFSPDGQQILFESNLTGERSLYLANADGTEIRRVVKDTQGACWY